MLPVLLALTGCRHRDLSQDDMCAAPPVEIRINWSMEQEAAGDVPELTGMRVLFFPRHSDRYTVADMDAHGNVLIEGLVLSAEYKLLCFDYFGNENIDFRGFTYENMEAYLIASRSQPAYSSRSSAVRTGEPTVWEPFPYTFYCARYSAAMQTSGMSDYSVDDETLYIPRVAERSDTVMVDFYPSNALHEFTFLIYNVDGAEHASSLQGSISGMSDKYRLASEALSSTPSTVLFGQDDGPNGYRRVQIFPDGKTVNWTQQKLDAILKRNAPHVDWLPNDLSKWGEDWIIGTFCVFGPVDAAGIDNILTVEVFNKRNNYFFGQWGDQWGDQVKQQIASSLTATGGQAMWRQSNGGFDIVLNNLTPSPENKPRLEIKPDGAAFEVGVDGWDDEPDWEISPPFP
jgi:hypothetical protein